MRRLLLLLSALPVLALAEAPLSLSLGEAEALWQQHSRELRLADTAVEGAAADRVTAGQRPNPELSFNVASISPSTGWAGGTWADKKMDSVLRLEQTIERGGKRDLRLKGAEARLAAAGLDRDDVARQQLALLRHSYHDLHLAQEKFRLASEAAELYGKSLAAAELRLRAGDLAPVELTRLAIDKARADNDARQARSELEQAQQTLAYLIGADPATPPQTDDVWPAPGDAELSALALDERPDLRAAARRIDAAEAERDLARAKRTRDIGVGMQVERNLQNAPTNSFGFGVTIPLFAWHAHEGEIARAESDYTLARQQYEQQKAQAGGQVVQVKSAVLAARDRLRRLESGLLADAERVAKAAEFAYTKGAMGLLDLLDARRTLRQIQVEAVTARADYAKAWADWQMQAEFGKKP